MANNEKKEKKKLSITIRLLKKWWFWVIVVSVFAIIFVIPFIIHCIFKFSPGNEFWSAEWTAGEVLGFYGAFLGFVDATVLGVVAVWQNIALSKINYTLQEKQIIASSKSCISGATIKDENEGIVLVDNGTVYFPALMLTNSNVKNGYHSSINYNVEFENKNEFFVTAIKTNKGEIYYDYCTYDNLNDDDHPGYFRTDDLGGGGYCRMDKFRGLNNKWYHVDQLNNFKSSFSLHLLIDFLYEKEKRVVTLDEVEEEKNFERDVKNAKLFAAKLANGIKSLIILECQLLNNFKVVTKGYFEFEINYEDKKNIVKSAYFVPTEFNYIKENTNE